MHFDWQTGLGLLAAVISTVLAYLKGLNTKCPP